MEQILANIRNDKRVIVGATLSELNSGNINEIYKIVKEANVKGLGFSFFTPQINESSISNTLLDDMIRDIKVLKASDPEFILVSDKMLETIKYKRHIKNCVLRKGFVVSYAPNLSRKVPCILGEGIDCSNCGCVIPVSAHCLKIIDIETLKMLRKVFS